MKLRAFLYIGFCLVVCPGVFYSLPADLVFAQDAAALAATGPVTSVDTVNNTVTISITPSDTSSQGIFYVNGDTVISRGEELIGLADIKAADQITVNYSSDNQSKTTATSIVVKT